MQQHLKLAERLAAEFIKHPNCHAVGLGGSGATQKGDGTSDIDLYVFFDEILPLSFREELTRGISRKQLDLQFWDTGDQWFDDETGIEVDVMYWHKDWIEGEIERTLDKQIAWMGYTSCFWHTVKEMKVLQDPREWLSKLTLRSQVAYPQTLKRDIIGNNLAVMSDAIPSYVNQINKAAKRGDLISVQHRVTALLESYFDVLFALNELPHPGEKRLLQALSTRCSLKPETAESDLQALMSIAPADPALPALALKLTEELVTLCRQHGFLPKAL